jgi:hypothetical protein
MTSSIRLRPKPKKLLDHTDTDIIDRYKDYLLEDEDRHIWLSKTVLIDVDQVVMKRFACDTRLCIKHKKSGGAKPKYSCCWDLEVQLLPSEIPMVERHLDAVFEDNPRTRRAVGEEGFWEYDEEWWKILRKKEDESCVFLTHSDELGRQVCALHATSLKRGIPLEEIKPLICRMFPLFLLETDDINIITFYSPDTHRLLFEEEYTRMNCLHKNEYMEDRVYVYMKQTLVDLVGEEGYALLDREAERILRKRGMRKKSEENGKG